MSSMGKKTPQHTLTFNARSANFLNHERHRSELSPLIICFRGQPVSAKTARRVELGVRFAC
jgi:hypothetical protein